MRAARLVLAYDLHGERRRIVRDPVMHARGLGSDDAIYTL
jgi:hypothetical protein